MSTQPDIIYTKVDEAPELASGSFLPIIQSFAKTAGVNVGTKDISLAGRIISQFPDKLKPEQQQPDDLALLGEIVLTPGIQCHQIPEYQCLHSTNSRVRQRIAIARLCDPRLPRRPQDG